MRLTHLKLAGFKSFVDPTTIPMPGQLIGIVGPNGCGKSNIIDAVRWVLGESQAKHLRGESMQDVIFNGTTARKPYGRASVELIFDNSLGSAAGQWSEYAEISVKRVLERNGESTYYINNTHVRRRDVTDIFLGTGLGPRAYGIIEQGMISGIVEARPEDLRLFLEEAAGVSKYRVRRRETELRLNDTRENLTRVEDIRQELEKQVQRLEAQAQVAEQYQILQMQVNEAQHRYWFLRKRDAEKEEQRIQLELQRFATELEQKIANLRAIESQLEEARSQHFSASDKLHQIQGLLYSANAEVARLEQTIQHQRENHKQVCSQLEMLQQSALQINQQLETSGAALASSQEELLTLQELMLENESALSQETNKLPVLEANFAHAEEEFRKLQRDMTSLEQTRQVEEANLSHLNRSVEQLQQRELRLRQEASQLAPGDEMSPQLEADFNSSADALKISEAEFTALSAASQEQTNVKRQAQEMLQSARHEINRIEAEKAARERLQQHFSHDENLEGWLTKHALNANSRLWRAIKIEKGWESALESVLRDRLSALALNRLEEAESWPDDLPPWNFTVFESPQDDKGEPEPSDLIPLRRYISGTPSAVLSDWLHQVYAIEEMGEGWSRRHVLAPGACLVSREGHIFTRHSVSFYAPQAEVHGVLSRQSEIEQLDSELQAQRIVLNEREQAFTEAEATLERHNSRLEELRGTINAQQQAHYQTQMNLERHRQQQQHREERRLRNEKELQEISLQLEHDVGATTICQQNLTSNRESLNDVLAQLTAAKTTFLAAESTLNAQRATVQKINSADQEMRFNLKHILQRINDFEMNVAGLQQQYATLNEQASVLQGTRDAYDEGPLQGALQEALSLQKEHEHKVAEQREDLEVAANLLQELERQRLASDQELEPMREKIGVTKLKEQEALLQKQQFQEQLANAAADEAALMESTPPNMKPNVVQNELNRLQAAILELGAVNLAALQELKTEQERKEYLDSQSQDLEQAMATLQEAIGRIDRETRERLEVTFKEVNQYLDELFPAVFGGGQAQLVLTGEHILDAGLQLIAQPPGKKTSSIHLLSGGEKALTALALVFSLFRLNPSPFCMLDEVDAPLDDANTERFCELVKRMSQYTQFIFISHNKISMEMAQQLIGVTMRESGVSHVVAVDMEEALKFTEKTPA